MTRLLVLAGGFGTRLRSAVADVPKPLAPVAGRPYLHYLDESWAAQGVTAITFLLHYQAERMRAFVKQQQQDGPLKNCAVDVVVEPTPLGTGGAIAYAVQQLGIQGDFLVANADTWLGNGIRALASTSAPAMATIEVGDTGRYGNVDIGGGKVQGFHEKQESRCRGWINAGLYHLGSDLFGAWDGAPYSIERDVFPGLARSGRLNAVALDTDFIDIGVPEDYFRFCRWIESGKRVVL
jgi:D-glycero-alpha-D-manno-heptose 1-phosphate guanylyltransferase